MLSPSKKNVAKNSPTKQNLSPLRKNNQSQLSNPSDQKNNEHKIYSHQLLLSSICELQTIILKLGGKVPSHLCFGFNFENTKFQNAKAYTADSNQKQYKIKLVQADYQSQLSTQAHSHRTQASGKDSQQQGLRQQIKSLKIKLSNYQFQIKKRQQDEAEYKIMSKLDRDKQLKRLRTQITKLQTQLRQENAKWEDKFVEMRTIYQKQNEQAISQQRLMSKKRLEQIIEETRKEKDQLITKYTEQIALLKQNLIRQIEAVQKKCQNTLVQKQEEHQRQLQRVHEKNVSIIQKIQKKQQQMIVAFDSQKKVERQKQQEIQISSNKLKQKLYNDLYLVRKQKQELNKTIVELKANILQLEKQKQNKGFQIQMIKKSNTQEMNKINISHVHSIQKINHKHKLQVKQLYAQYYKKFTHYQKAIKKIQENKINRQEILKQQIQDLQCRFAERPSRNEDVSQIQKLNYLVMQKDQEINQLKNQIQQIHMERQNNQKNYYRIFASQPPKQSRAAFTQRQRPVTAVSREKQREKARQRQRQSQKILLKKGSTIDFSFILKACNKNF